jgi:hypothetical protein
LEKEEVELLPSGLVSCLLDDREVRILKISPEKLTVRTAEEIEKIYCIKVVFYKSWCHAFKSSWKREFH